MQHFVCKKSAFYGKNSTFTQSNSVRDFLAVFPVFVRLKTTVNENVSFIDYASGIWLPDCFKLSINWKNDNNVPIC